MDPLGMKIYGNSILVPGCGGRHCPERGLGGKFVECCMWEGIFFFRYLSQFPLRFLLYGLQIHANSIMFGAQYAQYYAQH